MLTEHPMRSSTSQGGLHHDRVAEEALGGHTADLGRMYFRSPGFVGTLTVSQQNYSYMLSL